MTTRKPRAPGVRRRQYDTPQQQEPQVEMERLDPEAFLRQGAEQEMADRKLRDPEAELMAHAIPVDTRKVATQQPLEKKPEAEVRPPPPPPPSDPLDRVLSGSLIDRLAQRFAVKPEETKDAILEAGGETLKVTFRKPHYDDILWGLGEIESRILLGVDISLLRGDQARQNYLKHIRLCRAVVKVEDEYVWDIFDETSKLRNLLPNWDGQTSTMIPDLIKSELAVQVHALLRKLHEDLLFELAGAVEEAFQDATEPDVPDESAGDEGDEGDEEDPS